MNDYLDEPVNIQTATVLSPPRPSSTLSPLKKPLPNKEEESKA